MPGLTRLVRHPIVRDVLLVVGWFGAAGVVGALVWWQVTPLAEFTRVETGQEMGEGQLGRLVAADGWFFVIAAVGGLLSGIALLSLRRRDPVVMVVLVAVASLGASWLMLRVGLWLGPPDPESVLSTVSSGETVPVQLELRARGVQYVWPVATLLGAIGVIWGLDDHPDDRAIDGSDATRSG